MNTTSLTRDEADKLFRALRDQFTALAAMPETVERIVDGKGWVALGHDTFHAAWLAYRLDEYTAAIKLRPTIVLPTASRKDSTRRDRRRCW